MGIVVDQMRQEYLLRFSPRFQEGGFKRLINEGYIFKNAHFSYIPTYMVPGHTSVYTGTTPTNHGIIANHWYDRADKAEVYCASDTEVATVGAKSESGLMSPKRLAVTTVTDELRFSNQMASEVIGISINLSSINNRHQKNIRTSPQPGAGRKFSSFLFFKMKKIICNLDQSLTRYLINKGF